LPVSSAFPSWDNSLQTTFPASSVSLISGEKEAVLIDALITTAKLDAEPLVRFLLGARSRSPEP